MAGSLYNYLPFFNTNEIDKPLYGSGNIGAFIKMLDV